MIPASVALALSYKAALIHVSYVCYVRLVYGGKGLKTVSGKLTYIEAIYVNLVL